MNGPASPLPSAPELAPKLALVPAHADILAWAAETLAQTYRSRLPDLSSLTVLLPAAAQIPRLRRQLTQHCGAILGPNITTLAGFAAQAKSASTLSALDCKLILTEALRAHPGAFPGQDSSALAEALFGLFEELSANTPELAEDEARFLARIERGYGARLAQASVEAKSIYLLWSAYLRETAGRSPAVAYTRQLRDALRSLAPGERVVLVGFDSFSPSEKSLLREALTGDQLCVWLQGPIAGRGRSVIGQLSAELGGNAVVIDLGEDDCARAFDDSGTPLQQRIRQEQASRIQLAEASQAEHEARMVDLAVRRILLEKPREIAVVTQDRALARRLRALLERANIALRDEAGWALSTSSAASSLGHWLDCCDSDFPFRAVLDLLKSSFYEGASTTDIDTLERAIYASRDNVNGIERLRALADVPRELLAPLQSAARMVSSTQGTSRKGAEWSQMLINSLQALPLWRTWQNDAAGALLIRQIEELHAALQRQKPLLGWTEFRAMLERLLETAGFIPETSNSPVRLLSPEQARGLRCDVLILAGASAAQFPGKPGVQAVFNHNVRTELGLPNWLEEVERQLARFRGLMHAAPQVLITYAAGEEDESAQVCPWAEALQVTRLASVDPVLPVLAASRQVEISNATTLPTPELAPRPSLPVELLPQSLSATAHQALVDCPYKFFASSGLGLRQLEEPDEAVDRSDFGERVHAILHAFHEQIPGLPKAYAGKISAQHAGDMEHTLRQITYAVLADDLRNRALAQVWLVEINTLIPDLVQWMIARHDQWPSVRGEVEAHQALNDELRLHGFIDRLETDGYGNHGIVDYKTGTAPSVEEVLDGEKVQATHYALLEDSCTSVEYLVVKRGQKSPKPIQGDELLEAAERVRKRLIDVFAALRRNAPLPAHGDTKTCELCEYRGLCRVDTWAEGSA